MTKERKTTCVGRRPFTQRKWSSRRGGQKYTLRKIYLHDMECSISCIVLRTNKATNIARIIEQKQTKKSSRISQIELTWTPRRRQSHQSIELHPDWGKHNVMTGVNRVGTIPTELSLGNQTQETPIISLTSFAKVPDIQNNRQ